MSDNLKLYGVIAVLIAFIALGGTTFYYYSQLKSTEIELTETKDKLTAVEKELKAEKDNNIVLASEVKSGLNRLKLMSDMYDTAEKARLTQLDENKKLQGKITTITAKLPKPVTKVNASKESEQELLNSELRIKLIWEVFCVNNVGHEACQNSEMLKPSQEPDTSQPVNERIEEIING